VVRFHGLLALILLLQSFAFGTEESPNWQQLLKISDRGLPTLSTSSSSTAPTELRAESSLREALATQLVRGKIENLLQIQVIQKLRAALQEKFTFQNSSAHQLAKELDQLNNIELFSSESQTKANSSSQSCQIKAGVDFRNSTSKIEYVEKDLEVGIYHNRTLTAIAGAEPITQNLTFRLNKTWQNYRLRASFDFPLAMPSYRASIAHDFSATVSSSITAQAPARGTQLARRIDLRVAFSF